MIDIPVPVIDVTDLYHPHPDCGANFHLVPPIALPEVDLLAVILDCTQQFREAVVDDFDPQFKDHNGPRDPGFIPVTQLNYIFGRDVPCAVGPFSPMTSPADPCVNRSARSRSSSSVPAAPSPPPSTVSPIFSARKSPASTSASAPS